MSHCTRFSFQYVDKSIICKVFENLKMKYRNAIVKTHGEFKWCADEHPDFYSYEEGKDALVAKSGGFNYFMEDLGGYYKLSIEKHDMNGNDRQYAQMLEDAFRKEYIKISAQEVVYKMLSQGHNAMLSETSKELTIMFGDTYEKSITIKYDNDSGNIIEDVKGVKGKSCVNLTEELENMLSSADVELQTEWTHEYSETSYDEFSIYELEKY